MTYVTLTWMTRLEQILDTFAKHLWGDWLMYVLVGIGILYTVATGAVQVRHFHYAFREKFWKPLFGKEKHATVKGSISSFQALCTAIASCVGSGNIVGVSTAILAGGLGAVFWMWAAAFVGMATKFGEIILGLKYREKNAEGEWVGGPFFYIEKGLKMKWLAVLCAFFMVLQIIGGNFIQSHTISGILRENFNVPAWLTGIVLTVFIFIVVLGGLQRLAKIAHKLVPFMASLYIIIGLVIIVMKIDAVPAVFAEIFRSAFSLRAAAGGTAGTVMALAMRKGVARGLYSNEAGEGSAPVIHAAAHVKHPVEQGLAGIVEVFMDTFVICTITALVLGVTGAYQLTDVKGSVLAIEAFASVFAPLRYLVLLSLLLFSTTTLMSQWYFGFVGLNYIFGFNVADKFKYIFPAFCLVGAMLHIDLVWTIQDIALGLLTLPNLLAMVVLVPVVRRTTRNYFKESGLYNPHPQ